MARRIITEFFNKIRDAAFTAENIPVIGEFLYRVNCLLPSQIHNLTSTEPYDYKLRKTWSEILEEDSIMKRKNVPEKIAKRVERYVKNRSESFYTNDVAEELDIDYWHAYGALEKLASIGKVKISL